MNGKSSGSRTVVIRLGCKSFSHFLAIRVKYWSSAENESGAREELTVLSCQKYQFLQYKSYRVLNVREEIRALRTRLQMPERQ